MFRALAQKYYKHALAAVLAIIILLSIFVFFFAPKIAHGKVVAGLQSAGFDTSFIKKPRAVYGAILYKDVAFDKDAFTNAKYIQVHFNPLMLLFGKFKDINIIGLNITGNWSGPEFSTLSYAGWHPPTNLAKVPLTNFKHISLTDARLSLLTQTSGGVSVFFNVSSSRNDGKTEFQANLKSQQKFISFSTNASGVIEGARWYTDVEITDGKFEDPAGRYWGSRVNGKANLSKAPNESLKIMSDLGAGGLNLYGLPWQTVSGTLEYTEEGLKFLCEAKSIGQKGLELELNVFQSPGAGPGIGGALHAETAQAFFDYFAGRPNYEDLLKKLVPYKKDENIEVAFVHEEGKLRYEIRKDNVGTGVFGEVTPEVP